MKLRIVSNCVIKGQPAQAGELVDVDDATAEYLVSLGRAQPAGGKASDAPGAKAAKPGKPSE